MSSAQNIVSEICGLVNILGVILTIGSPIFFSYLPLLSLNNVRSLQGKQSCLELIRKPEVNLVIRIEASTPFVSNLQIRKAHDGHPSK